MRFADHVIAISRFAAPPLPSAKCSIIYNAVEEEPKRLDRAVCRQQLLDEMSLPSNTNLLGFFADIDKTHKRPEVFLETVGLIGDKWHQLRVDGLLFGQSSPATERQLRARADSLGIADRMHFMGFRYPPGPWLAGCDLLVVPGVHQGFGRTLIEAMLVGTIAVAADSGGHREIIKDGETGFLVRPDDAQALADQICQLLERRADVAALARRARKDALERLSVRRHVQSVSQVYDALLTGGRRPT